MRGAGILLLLVPLVPGCLSPLPAELAGPREEWRFEGTFAPDFIPEDVVAVCRAATGGDACEFGQSDPPYYHFPSVSEGECERLKQRILDLPRTRLLSGCRRVA